MAIDALSHVAPILPTDVEQRISDLAERGHLHGLHQFFKHVPALLCDQRGLVQLTHMV
jgi:hypothetical protein